MKLSTLKPTLPLLNASRVKMLEAKAGATERMRGRAWMETRKAALTRGRYACVDCGHVGMDNEIDHDVPLEQGGSHDQSNLRIRCKACHKAKTAREAAHRAAAGSI